jgi:poly[(R)-3-hydroxyalkanoate] polymerase subunit PhaC
MTAGLAAARSDPAAAGAASYRRRGPRPLALHLAQTQLAWNGREGDTGFAGSSARFLRGLHAYWRHPYRRQIADPDALWARGSTRLLDYGPAGGLPVLVVPSLINRAYILDLAPERSLLRYLAAHGIRSLLVDWGPPGRRERRMTLDDYVVGRLEGALDEAHRVAGRAPLVLGYCMGGLLALALAARRAEAIAGLALLATPWDFHASDIPPGRLAALMTSASAAAGALGGLPVELIQTLFAGIDPLGVARKFARFAELDPGSAEAATFVAVEDWLNDGVPLAAEVARECLLGWYVENRPARGTWRVGGRAVRPERFTLPCLVAIPTRDRIVPPRSAAALAEALPDVAILRPAGGHIGMIVGSCAANQLWAPLADWLRRIAAMQK